MVATKRMTLTNDEFLSEYGGRMPAGSAVEVDEATANKWERLGIAGPSKKADKSAREMRKAELQAQLEALEEEDQFAHAITAATASRRPGSQAAQRTATTAPQPLTSDDIINGPEPDDDIINGPEPDDDDDADEGDDEKPKPSRKGK